MRNDERDPWEEDSAEADDQRQISSPKLQLELVATPPNADHLTAYGQRLLETLAIPPEATNGRSITVTVRLAMVPLEISTRIENR